eukprot:8762454-Pyramimonas_sp.AAC.1
MVGIPPKLPSAGCRTAAVTSSRGAGVPETAHWRGSGSSGQKFAASKSQEPWAGTVRDFQT